MRVLIVDDHRDVCLMHARVVRHMGHDVWCVEDPKEAIAEAKRFSPDVALIDICLPEVDGWQLAEQLRADSSTRHIRLVAISALGGPYELLRSAQAGFERHFCKPVPIQRWREVLEGAAPALRDRTEMRRRTSAVFLKPNAAATELDGSGPAKARR